LKIKVSVPRIDLDEQLTSSGPSVDLLDLLLDVGREDGRERRCELFVLADDRVPQ
jgi:hypothetical protein